MAVVEAEIVVRDRLGIHARPAARICQVACRFECEIRLRSPRSVKLGSETLGAEPGGFDDADGKAIMQILVAAFCEGERVIIHAEGDDAAEAVAALVELFEKEPVEE